MAKGFGSVVHTKSSDSFIKNQQAVDAKEVQEQWLSFFSPLEDPRGKQGREHKFISIVMIAILAVIGGANGWDDIELYAIAHEDWLATFLELPNGLPRADISEYFSGFNHKPCKNAF